MPSVKGTARATHLGPERIRKAGARWKDARCGMRDAGSVMRDSRSRLPSVRRDEGDGPVRREGLREDIRPREAVHVAADRQTQKIEDRRGDVDDRSALTTA